MCSSVTFFTFGAKTHIVKIVSRNNAGVMYCPFQLSEDGIEMQFATNHIGSFIILISNTNLSG